MPNLCRFIFSFLSKTFTGKISSEVSYEVIIEQFFIHLYDLLSIMAFGFFGMVLVIIGFFVAYFDLLSQYDEFGSVRIGAIFLGSLALIFGGLILINNVKKNKSKLSSPQLAQASHVPIISPLEEAISALIFDFVTERQMAREMAKKNEKDKNQSEENEHSPVSEVNIQ